MEAEALITIGDSLDYIAELFSDLPNLSEDGLTKLHDELTSLLAKVQAEDKRRGNKR